MDITLTRNPAPRKNLRLAIYKIEGRPGSVQFFRALFPKDAVPAQLTLTGTFAEPKAKETPAERKARRALLPKLTPAERLAKMEARIAKMKAQLAAQPTAAQPKAPLAMPPAAPKVVAKSAKR